MATTEHEDDQKNDGQYAEDADAPTAVIVLAISVVTAAEDNEKQDDKQQ